MRLLIIILLFSTQAQAQLKKDWPVYALQFIAGSADGVSQAIAYHGLGKGTRFWDADISWKNKYRNWPEDKREAYPFSKSALVWTTDGYHLVRAIDRSAMLVSIGLSWRGENWKKIAKKILLSSISNRIGFYLFYDVIFKNK